MLGKMNPTYVPKAKVRNAMFLFQHHQRVPVLHSTASALGMLQPLGKCSSDTLNTSGTSRFSCNLPAGQLQQPGCS